METGRNGVTEEGQDSTQQRGDGIDWARLTAPFDASEVLWRLQKCGVGDKGEIWARCLAYVDARAIMERLDAVVGPADWQSALHEGPAGGVAAGLGIRVNGEWIWKWDGADNTKTEAVKGGISGAIRRAAVQWGIGRYLYDLSAGRAIIGPNGQHGGETKDPKRKFKWDPPALPSWALPGGSGKPPAKSAAAERAQSRAKTESQSEPRSGSRPEAKPAPVAKAAVVAAVKPATRAVSAGRAAASVATVEGLREILAAPEWTGEERTQVEAWLNERARTEEEVGLRAARATHELKKRRDGTGTLAIA